MPLGGRRLWTRSIQRPERSASAERFFSAASQRVSKRPIWLGDAAPGNCGPAADDPAHRRIMPKPLSVVHVLIAGEASKDGLPEQSGQGVPAILAGAGVGQNLARHVRQSERVVEFSVGEQAGVGGHDRSPKLQLQSAIEIEPRLRGEVRPSPQLQMYGRTCWRSRG